MYTNDGRLRFRSACKSSIIRILYTQRPRNSKPFPTRSERLQEPINAASPYEPRRFPDRPRERHQGQGCDQSPLQRRLGERQAVARPHGALGGEPLPLRRPIRGLPRLHLRPHPGAIPRGEGLPARQHVRGGDRGRPPHRPPDSIRGSLRHHSRAGDQPGQHVAHDARPAELVLRRGDAGGPDRGGRRPGGRARIAGALDLPQADADAAREIQVHRRGSGVLRSAHRVGRDPRRARVPDRARARHDARAPAALPQDLRDRRRDAPALHHRPLLRLRGEGRPAKRARPRRQRRACGRARAAASMSALTEPQPRVDEFRNLIGGEWASSATQKTFDDLNPADTRDIVGRFQASGAADARAAVAAAAAAFDGWRKTPISRRAKVLQGAADHLEAHAGKFAEELTREEGKSLALARDEVLRSAQTLRFYAVEGQSFSGETFPNDDPDMIVYSAREPLGVVTAITPWNFPVSIPARKIAPALITGNTVVFKPSSDAPLIGYRLTEAFVAAGIPKGVINLITGAAAEVGPAITEAPAVRAISFTGSTAAGEQIHRAVPLTTRTQMELGGKNPLIVMADADLDKAVDLAIKGGLSLTGLACTGTSRLIVFFFDDPASTEKLVAKIRAMKIGSGTDATAEIGPLATAKQLETVLRYVAIGREEATLLCGGERLTGAGYDHGYYVSPAVFADVTQQMRIAREEIFGPVLAIIEAASYEDAIAKANDTEYGLSAAIATRDPRTMHRFAQDIQSGTVKINRTTTGNLVNAPFGGVKRSSTSTFRESGRAGLEFYTQIKTVYQGI